MTTLTLGCGLCGKAFVNNGQTWSCPKCVNRRILCNLCHEPVDGTFAWCQGCGHGGHLHHMTEWFAHENECPSGCGHQCTPFIVSSKPSPPPPPPPPPPLTPSVSLPLSVAPNLPIASTPSDFSYASYFTSAVPSFSPFSSASPFSSTSPSPPP
eukprot:CAMPEP_0201542050 /NCGR_PEP_ID=MMETSP0161_2-20130828/71813_1 /ASSEMBLY_ACC=CAM_ASM_000251 /TAXON_ID=180227 /ORGANISM="Neoparamoeba aestuarina, Strain SoJaBio B1-5/56/2" /LENGTH=153 /DNA_ID=CAMNT_0047949647 /DNA_START=609 /DNA_END=1066 /DNA_ORIENTATION=-